MGSPDLRISDVNWAHEPGHSAFGIFGIRHLTSQLEMPNAEFQSSNDEGSWVGRTSNFWTRIGTMNCSLSPQRGEGRGEG